MVIILLWYQGRVGSMCTVFSSCGEEGLLLVDHYLVLTQTQKQSDMPGLSNKLRLLWLPDHLSGWADELISVTPPFSLGSYLTLTEEEDEQFPHHCEESTRGCVGVHGSKQIWGRGGCVLTEGQLNQLRTMCRRKISSQRSRYFM